jgi:anti-sigma B factor antagonist
MQLDSGRLRLTVHRTGDDVLIELVGRLDTEGRLRFREQVRILLGRGGGTVTVDVGGLEAVDIAGMAAVLRADLLLRGVRTHLRIRSATPAFLELVAATGLAARLDVLPAAKPGC